jgi:hypothetical protein
MLFLIRLARKIIEKGRIMLSFKLVSFIVGVKWIDIRKRNQRRLPRLQDSRRDFNGRVSKENDLVEISFVFESFWRCREISFMSPCFGSGFMLLNRLLFIY